MTKVIKLQLYYKDDERLNFKKAQETLWQLQREVRAAANRAIQMCWEFNGFEADWKKKNGEYLTKDEKGELLGKSLQSVIYDKVKEDAPDLNTSNLCSTLQAVTGKFNSMKRDIICGNASIPSYKKNMPIDLHKKSIKLYYETDENGAVTEWLFELSLLSNKAKKELDLKSGSLTFKAVVPARSKKYINPILERCSDEVYTICGSKLKYDNGKWYLLLCFSFEKKADETELDKNNIMGVHIAENNAVTCTFNNSKRILSIDGGEIVSFSAQIEKRRRSIGNASRKHSDLCGDGRIGHGYHAKMKPLDNIGKKVANFRNTVNHRYSRQIVNWAVQNNCGTIQLEDLTGFAAAELEKYKLMKSWSYYDLMTKIEAKAKEYGISVIKLPYRQLQKWCSNCNSLTVERVAYDSGEVKYICSECGEIFDLDKLVQNAVAVPSIADIIKNQTDNSENENIKNSPSGSEEDKHYESKPD